MKSYQIHFIRHGACDETRKGEYVGTKDVELSKEGAAELKQLLGYCMELAVHAEGDFAPLAAAALGSFCRAVLPLLLVVFALGTYTQNSLEISVSTDF